MSTKYPAMGVDSLMLSPVAIATTERTANLDTAGANYATIRCNIGVELNTNATNVPIQILEADNTSASSFVTFNASFQRTIDNASGTIATSHIDLEGRKRYLRLVVTPDTTTNGTVSISAIGTLYKDVRSGTVTDYGTNTIIG